MTARKPSWAELRRRRLEREKRDTARLAEAFENLAMKRVAGELVKIFTSHGVGVIEAHTETLREKTRIKSLLERDRFNRSRDEERERATLEVHGGLYVNIAETVMEPTPEWLSKGNVRTHIPRQHDRTTKLIKTVRRMAVPVVARLLDKGIITEDQHSACVWYQERFEVAGLTGRWASNRYAQRTGSSGSGSGPMALHEFEAQARNEFRAAHAALDQGFTAFFDAVVLADLPLGRASRFARCRNARAPHHFRMIAQQLVDFCDSRKLSFRPTAKSQERD